MDRRPIETLSVIGLGYIGLPTAALFAGRGLRVLGIDSNDEVVRTVAKGMVHIVEPDLDGLVQKVVSSGRLTAHTKVEQADAFIIAVPAPVSAKNRPDLSYIESAARAPVLKKGDLVIIESTIPVGTTERIARLLADARPDLRLLLIRMMRISMWRIARDASCRDASWPSSSRRSAGSRPRAPNAPPSSIACSCPPIALQQPPARRSLSSSPRTPFGTSTSLMRPALEIVEELARTYGPRVVAVEPFIKTLPDSLEGAGVRLLDALSAIDEASVIVLLVDHRQFRMNDPKQLRDKVIIDTRGLWHGKS